MIEATGLDIGDPTVDPALVPGWSGTEQEVSESRVPREPPLDASPDGPPAGFDDTDESNADAARTIRAPEETAGDAGETSPTPPVAEAAPPGHEPSLGNVGLGGNIVASLPHEELEPLINTVPGLAEHADDLSQALAAMPLDSIPLMMRVLPPDLVRGIAGLKRRKGD